MVTLFVISPIVIWQFNHMIAAWLLPFLSVIGALCLLLLVRDHQFKRFRLTNKLGFNKRIAATLLLFVGLMVISTVAFSFVAPEKMFIMPMYWTSHWLLLLFLYPLFSALPQEIIFRTFFFHRYKYIIPSKLHRIWLSAIIFGFAHIIYGNWIAVMLSFLAGYCFAQSYAASRSTMLVAVEHSLWGAWLFTLGLGHYFDLSKQVQGVI